jgi:hypothetical protein
MGKNDLNKLIKLASQIADENANIYGKQIKKSYTDKEIFRPDSFIRLADDAVSSESIDPAKTSETGSTPGGGGGTAAGGAGGGGSKAPETSPMSALKNMGGNLFDKPIHSNPKVAAAAANPFDASEYATSDKAAFAFYELLLQDLYNVKSPEKKEGIEEAGSPTVENLSADTDPFSSSSGPTAYNRKFTIRYAVDSTIPPPDASKTGTTDKSSESFEKGKSSIGDKVMDVVNPPDESVLRSFGLLKPDKPEQTAQGFNRFWIANRARLEKTLFTVEYGVASVGQGGRGGEEVRSLFAIGINRFAVNLQKNPQIAAEMSDVLQSLRLQILGAAFGAKANKAKSALQTGFKWWDALSRSIGR